jgi:preprotein translocase subunit SecD
MLKSIKLRALLALIVCLAGLFFLIPSLTSDLPDVWKKYLPADKIRLGLDLQGGMHLVLEVNAEKAVETTMERITNDMRETLMDNKVRFRNIERTRTNLIVLETARRGRLLKKFSRTTIPTSRSHRLK